PVVENGEVRIERLRGGAVGMRLHLVRERLVLLVASRERVGGIDRDLAFEAGHLGERLGDRARWNGDQDDIGAGGVAAATPERRDGVSGLFPEASESAADVAPTDGRDLHARL